MREPYYPPETEQEVADNDFYESVSIRGLLDEYYDTPAYQRSEWIDQMIRWEDATRP